MKAFQVSSYPKVVLESKCQHCLYAARDITCCFPKQVYWMSVGTGQIFISLHSRVEMCNGTETETHLPSNPLRSVSGAESPEHLLQK